MLAARTTGRRLVVRPTPGSSTYFPLSVINAPCPCTDKTLPSSLQRRPRRGIVTPVPPKRIFLTLPGWPLERGGSPSCAEEWHLGTRPLAALMRVGYLQPLPCATPLALGAAWLRSRAFSAGAVSGFFFGFQFTLSTAGNRCDVTPSIGGQPGTPDCQDRKWAPRL